uniref:Uncharacterized protein n=1 Tax=Rhizophora mucronata TaxID=61149 RepID=A0A2P2QB14_RHIMU
MLCGFSLRYDLNLENVDDWSNITYKWQ